MKGSKNSSRHSTAGANILLIEDNSVILKVHKILLEGMGFHVDTAMMGADALIKFKNFRYDLILLDGGLPDTDGRELGLKMREHEKATNGPRTPFILLTGFTEELARAWCCEADIDEYAIKPVHPVKLKQVISRVL